MPIVDAQIHEPAMSLEWTGADPETRWAALLEAELAYLRAVGVDRAILHPRDVDWSEWAAQQCPGRFAIVPMLGDPRVGCIDATRPDIADYVEAKAANPAVVGMRIIRSADPDWVQPFLPAVRAAVRHGLAVFVRSPGDLPAVEALAEEHPSAQFVVDHIGMPQPSMQLDSPPFRTLPDLLALAGRSNIAVKLTGAPSMSLAPYPYPDLWPSLRQIIDAFGAERIMWGSDISRFMDRIGFGSRKPERSRPSHTYAEALHYLRHSPELSAQEKAAMLGGTALALLRWPDEPA